jgi:hypothetical protein
MTFRYFSLVLSASGGMRWMVSLLSRGPGARRLNSGRSFDEAPAPRLTYRRSPDTTTPEIDSFSTLMYDTGDSRVSMSNRSPARPGQGANRA